MPLRDINSSFTGYFAIGEADITPPVDIYARNWGAAAHDQATGVHRPLLMQCLLFGGHDPGQMLVLITADLGWWKNGADERRIRESLLGEFGLKEHQLLFCLSHTHAGPVICSGDADKPGGEHIIPYLEKLKATAAELISNGLRNLQPGTLTWAYGVCDLATNRDLPQGNTWLVGYHPDEQADDTLLVGVIRDEQQRIYATLVNYACHPTTLAHENRFLSPDYVGAMREVVSAATTAPCLFLQGASGELAPKEQYVADTGIADRHGRRLGYAVLAALESLLPAREGLELQGSLTSGAPLALWKRFETDEQPGLHAQVIEVEVPLKDLPSAAEIEREWQTCEDRVLKDRLWRKLNTRRTLGDLSTAKLQVWVWELGDSMIIAQANEAYSLFQTALRAAFPGKAISVINIANGYVGYLPPESYYDQDMYSIWQTPYDKGALEALIGQTITVIKRRQ